ncbi:MAG: 50S ribosomal protein L36 [Candidatus Dojkabacteria bacterium]|uniref:50S ribosomal protein L36 n=2 Tax=Candidatus Dojkabacteria TaxID=74243 RepID=A0A136KKY5_9BACT|nr:MAG: 50S ribosomal protein L36 [candidate division WS6 bacterium OLB21]MBW7953605.1 50S ribosomal protein L36 [Candidatus Dojkabacteria bacterium]WKZ27879.1 MAG: 50S ribosomal protein L36 [Candidatus Dojkabacteria bacterium]
MKVKASVKKRCEYCYLVKRRNSKGVTVTYVYCKRNARHKQRQG